MELGIRYKGEKGQELFYLCCFWVSPVISVSWLDKVHFVLLRGIYRKIWQSCLIMVALIILHFSFFSVKCEFHHCNLEWIFVQLFFLNPPSWSITGKIEVSSINNFWLRRWKFRSWFEPLSSMNVPVDDWNLEKSLGNLGPHLRSN